MILGHKPSVEGFQTVAYFLTKMDAVNDLVNDPVKPPKKHIVKEEDLEIPGKKLFFMGMVMGFGFGFGIGIGFQAGCELIRFLSK